MFPLVSMATLRGVAVLIPVPAVADVKAFTSGVPVGLNSTRLPFAPLALFTTQILPDASAAMFCGWSSNVAATASVYWIPTVQSVGCVPTPTNGAVPVCNPYRAVRLVAEVLELLLVGFRLM